MAFFQGPSNFTIPNGNFTIVQGSQHINHFGGVAVQQAAEKEPTLWDEYKRLRACDVHLTRLVDGTGNARRDAEACQGVVARRTISIARISSEKDKEFLHVQYRGRYAYEEFEWDFKQFSGIKHPYIAQLFGYNDNRHGFPALIFYDALIPLERIIYTRGRLSLILYAYFSFQLAMQQTLTDGHDHVSMNELWVEPRSGALIRGPPIEIPSHVIRHIIPIRPDSASSRYLHPLCIQTYNNTQIVLQHLTEMLSARTVLRGIGRGGGVIVPVLTDEAAISLLRSPCAIYNLYDRRRVIARCARPKRQAYRLFEVFGFPDAIKETRTVMADGSVRFAITLPDNQYPRILIRLVYTVDLEEDRDTVEYAWLTQAHSVFRQLGICPDEWEDYFLFHYFQLDLDCRIRSEGLGDATWPTSPVYLFIRPIPQPSDDNETWISWENGRKILLVFKRYWDGESGDFGSQASISKTSVFHVRNRGPLSSMESCCLQNCARNSLHSWL